MKRLVAILVCLLLTLSLFACTAAKPAATTAPAATAAPAATKAAGSGVFKIGVHTPLTGPNALQGTAMLHSVQLYAKRLNTQGGFMGSKIEVIAYDDQNTPEVAATLATKLIEVDKVNLAINGIGSSCCLASGKLFDAAGIPAFGCGISKTFMAQGWKYQFRPTINSTISVSTLPTTWKELGFSKVAILTGQDDYGVNNRKAIVDNAPKAGIEVVADEKMVTGDTDFSGQVSAILSKNPDLVFIGINSGDVATSIKQLRQFGWNGLIYYSENLQKSIIDISGEAANHIAFAYPYVLYGTIDEIADPQMKEFYQLYKAEYGVLPEGDCAYRGWDTMLILDEAVKNGKSLEPKAIAEAVLNITGLDILAGTADFAATKNGECLTKYYNYIVIGGKNVAMADWLKTDDAKNYIKK